MYTEKANVQQSVCRAIVGTDMDQYMDQAISEAYRGIRARSGGPFGAVIVSDGSIIAKGHNEVVSSNDPTAHAEIVAIRRAAAALGRFDLSDCTLYTTCEPCPMCRSAIHWARIGRVVYGCDREDAARIGFDDNLLYEILAGTAEDESYVGVQEAREKCLTLFDVFESMEDRVRY